ncbi:unnamed protein product [Heligmosomoides polygyrus]|uniref:Uncharacterized protein n=1 Tax=Heligmosomoides polygyrus TaxID=6339 RepID=A0A183FT52_HELPZ|nr:unnamed protein product [Heligmosomoides polygyrus]
MTIYNKEIPNSMRKYFRKKASLRLLVLNTIMLFVLSFQLMFIRLLRKACRQNYENGVRDYIKMQKRQQERTLLRITGSKEISSGKNQGKGAADGAKPRVTLSKGPALKKLSQKTTGKGEQQGKKQQLSPFRWKSPLAKSSIANDVTDFYVVDKKSKAGEKRSRKHGAASIDARQAGEEKQSSDVFFEIARPKGDAGAKTDGFFALPRTQTQKGKSARRNDNMAALHHDKAQTNHKIAGNTDDFFAIPRNAEQGGEKEQKMGDFLSLPRNVRQKSGKASKSDDMVVLPHGKTKKSTVLKKSEDLVTKPLTAKQRSEQAKKINDIGAKAAQAKQKDGRVKK